MNGMAMRMANMATPRVLLILALALGVAGAQSGGGTLAYFTSTAASTSNVFTAGTVILKLTDPNDTSLSSITASIGDTNWKPGVSVAGYITTLNTGTLPFDYGVSYTLTNDTGTLVGASQTAIALQVYTAGATTNCTAANADGVGTGLTSVYSAAALVAGTPTTLFNSGGGTKRSLASGSEILCYVVRWTNGAAAAEDTQQGASSTLVLNYDARQQ